MTALSEILARLRPGYSERRRLHYETQLQRRDEFLDSLRPAEQANARILLALIDRVNEEWHQQKRGVRFSLIGRKVLKRQYRWYEPMERTEVDFEMAINAWPDTSLQEDAVNFVIGKTKTGEETGLLFREGFALNYQSGFSNVLLMGEGEEALTIYVSRAGSDSDTLAVAADPNIGNVVLLNPTQPLP